MRHMDIIIDPSIRQWVVKKTKKTDESIGHYLVIQSDTSTRKEQGVTKIPLIKSNITSVQTMLYFCIQAVKEYGKVIQFSAESFFTFIQEERFKDYKLHILPILSFFEREDIEFYHWLQHKYNEYSYNIEDLELDKYTMDKENCTCNLYSKKHPHINIFLIYCRTKKHLKQSEVTIQNKIFAYSYTTEVMETEKIKSESIQKIFQSFIENHPKLRMQLLLS